MDRLELTAKEMRTIMKALYDSEDDAAAELHDAIAGLFAREESMEGGENAAEIIVKEPMQV